MDIYKILNDAQKDGYKNLYPEDLEFFETELSTGSYTNEYKSKCRGLIELAKNWMEIGPEPKKLEEQMDGVAIPSSLSLSLDEIKPDKKEEKKEDVPISYEQIVARELEIMRDHSTYKTDFVKFINKNSEIDSAFIDKNYSIFKKWEVDTIVGIRQMDESFLEKYFDSIDPDILARNQCFSEEFFMKHYGKLDVNIVLKSGKNKWRSKRERSKQLDVFLRLKGVKI